MDKANPNYTYLKKSVPINRMTLLQGGTRSGKTFSIIDWLVWFCWQYSGVEVDIVRATFRSLKGTFLKDFKERLIEFEMFNYQDYNRTDHIYNLNGNVINFFGADSPDKLHGKKRDILILNEGNQLTEETVDQLFPRTTYRIIIDYNPALELDHWLDAYIDDYPPLITTYKDNPFLTRDQVLDIESRKNNKYWWSVYGTGERARPVGAIFENWKIGEFDKSLPVTYGQDYGFSNDPTTLVKVAVDNSKRRIYCHELLYKKELSTGEIAKINKQYAGDDLIVGDSAEPRLIRELQVNGLNIQPAEKGQGSVTAGISAMLDYEIIITPESNNLKKELNNYIWADKKSATPIDKNNHLIDAIRYAFSKLMGGFGNYAWERQF